MDDLFIGGERPANHRSQKPRLKILWTLPYLPWPTLGGNRLRVYHLLRSLAGRGHRVTLLVQSTHEPDADVRAKLMPLVERLIVVERRRRLHPVTLAAALFAPYPVDVSITGFSHRLRQEMHHLLEEEWDVVQIEHGYGLQSFLSLLERRRQPFVLTEHNVESSLVPTNHYHPRIPARLLPALHCYDGWRYRNWERRALAAPERLIAVTAEDGRRLSRIAGRPADVVPNGVDVPAFAEVVTSPDRPHVMFIGNFGYPPNDDAAQWAADQIMPLVWQQCAAARFIMCGNQMRAEWPRRWPDPRIEWRGLVPDVKAVQRECAVFIAPLRAGGGSKLKVLEAMAGGLAVVSTPEGVSGLAAVNGQDYLLGRTAPELAACLIELLRDPAKIRAIGAAGRRYVRAAHDWSALTDQLERIYYGLPVRSPSLADSPQIA